MRPFSKMKKSEFEHYYKLIQQAGKNPKDYIGVHSRFLHQSCDWGPCFGQDILIEKFDGGKTFAVKGEVDKQYIDFYDRNGIFRLSIGSGEKIPAGIIIGKGWTVKTSFRKVLVCRCGNPEHAYDFTCEFNDHNDH